MLISRLTSTLLIVGAVYGASSVAHADLVHESLLMDLSNSGPGSSGAPTQITGQFIYDTTASIATLVELSIPSNQFFWPTVSFVSDVNGGPLGGLQHILWQSIPLVPGSSNPSSIEIYVTLPTTNGGFSTTPYASFAGLSDSGPGAAYGNYNASISAVPEPGANVFALIGIGIVGVSACCSKAQRKGKFESSRYRSNI